MAQNFIRIADFNNNFSGSAVPINVMDSDLGKKIVRITDSKHNCSRTADLSMAASTDLAMKLRGSANPVPPFIPPPPMYLGGFSKRYPLKLDTKGPHISQKRLISNGRIDALSFKR